MKAERRKTVPSRHEGGIDTAGGLCVCSIIFSPHFSFTILSGNFYRGGLNESAGKQAELLNVMGKLVLCDLYTSCYFTHLIDRFSIDAFFFSYSFCRVFGPMHLLCTPIECSFYPTHCLNLTETVE